MSKVNTEDMKFCGKTHYVEGVFLIVFFTNESEVFESLSQKHTKYPALLQRVLIHSETFRRPSFASSKERVMWSSSVGDFTSDFPFYFCALSDFSTESSQYHAEYEWMEQALLRVPVV